MDRNWWIWRDYPKKVPCEWSQVTEGESVKRYIGRDAGMVMRPGVGSPEGPGHSVVFVLSDERW